ncbi:hypothetical protein J2T14_006056 [Paenibacillus harenae]|nr:hypothetical protein [Paenibacillus harenae]
MDCLEICSACCGNLVVVEIVRQSQAELNLLKAARIEKQIG